MKDLCRKFLSILLVELEDLREDLDLFVGVMENRHRSGEITDYVYNENLAVLRNELLGLKDCIRGCDDPDMIGRGTVDEMARSLKRRFRDRLREHGYVPALYALLDKRMDKIAAYLKEETEERRATGLPDRPPGEGLHRSAVPDGGILGHPGGPEGRSGLEEPTAGGPALS